MPPNKHMTPVATADASVVAAGNGGMRRGDVSIRGLSYMTSAQKGGEGVKKCTKFAQIQNSRLKARLFM